MKKMLKITGLVFAVLIVLVVIVMVAAKLLITPERVKKTVLPVAEKALKRKVSIGDINISLFSGISIGDFRVMMRDEDMTFVSAESLELSYKFWPLLKKQVSIDEVRLKNPEVRVVRNKDGSFNFSDLLENNSDGRSPASADPVKASVALAQEKDGGSAMDLMVRKVEITGGHVRFTDRFVDKEPFSSGISGLEFFARNISLKEPFPFELSGRLNDAAVSAKGTADPVGRGIKADVRISDLDPLDFEPYFRDRVPGRISSAKINLETSVEADARKVSSKGKLRVKDVDMVLEALPDVPFKNAGIAADYDLTEEPGAQNLKIRTLEADINGISMNAAGNVLYGAVPEIDISLELPETDIKKILAAIPEALAKTVEKTDPFGRIEVQIRLAGTADKPERLLQSGKVRLDSAGALINNLKASASGYIILSPDRIFSEETEVKLGGDTALLNFEITDYFSDPVRISNTVTAKRLDLDRLIAAAGGTGAKDAGNVKGDAGKAEATDKAKNSGNSSQKHAIGPFDLPVRAEGQIRVQEARYRGLPVQDLLAKYTLIDNVFTMESFSARVAEGEAKGEASINLGQKDMKYTANLLLQSINSSEIITAMYPKAGWMVSGTADINGDFSGRGIRMKDIRKTLTGRSDFKILNGRISGEQITGKLGPMLGAGNLKAIDFDSFKGNLKIAEGKVKVEGDFDGNEIKMKPSGMIGLDGSLDLSLNLRLAPGFSDRLSGDSLAGRLMTDSKGWTRLPVTVAGTVTSPKFALDSSEVRQQLRKKATEKFIEEGVKKLFK
ncbi:MAG: AsmA family protein [Desulfobacteraceae bacterium]|nr:AsmA family protein [Desulfobacteraceae bacterium]